VQVQRAEAQAHLLVATGGRADQVPPGWETHPVSSEELMLAYLRAPGKRAPAGPGLPGSVSLQRAGQQEATR
jgi:hypothetical protein